MESLKDILAKNAQGRTGPEHKSVNIPMILKLEPVDVPAQMQLKMEPVAPLQQQRNGVNAGSSELMSRMYKLPPSVTVRIDFNEQPKRSSKTPVDQRKEKEKVLRGSVSKKENIKGQVLKKLSNIESIVKEMKDMATSMDQETTSDKIVENVSTQTDNSSESSNAQAPKVAKPKKNKMKNNSYPQRNNFRHNNNRNWHNSFLRENQNIPDICIGNICMIENICNRNNNQAQHPNYNPHNYHNYGHINRNPGLIDYNRINDFNDNNQTAIIYWQTSYITYNNNNQQHRPFF